MKMKKGSCTWIRAAIFTAAGLLLWRACHIFREILPMTRQITITLEEGISSQLAEEIFDREAASELPSAVCFWRQDPRELLTCEMTGQSAEVDVISAVGNPGLVISESASLFWQEDGCFLDQKTARTLLGSVQARGQLIRWQGELRRVLGVFASRSALMICMETKERSAWEEISANVNQEERGQASLLLDQVSILPAKGTPRADAAEAFLLRSGLSGKTLDLTPSLTLPSRWSDFSFWKTLADRLRSNLLLLISSSLPGRLPDLVVGLLTGYLCAMGGFLLLVLGCVCVIEARSRLLYI